MVEFLIKLLLVARSCVRSRARLEAENIVLRQHVAVLSRKSGLGRGSEKHRPADIGLDVPMLPSILAAIPVVKPETVIRWYRRGFRAYWRWKSRRRGGRPRMTARSKSHPTD